jgi:hypothetical protein
MVALGAADGSLQSALRWVLALPEELPDGNKMLVSTRHPDADPRPMARLDEVKESALADYLSYFASQDARTAMSPSPSSLASVTHRAVGTLLRTEKVEPVLSWSNTGADTVELAIFAVPEENAPPKGPMFRMEVLLPHYDALQPAYLESVSR